MANDLYRSAMDGIAGKIALQSIRKILRDSNINDTAKLNIIMSIVHDYEEDREQAELTAERRAIEEDEMKLRRDAISDMFDEMAAGLDKVTGKGK